MNRLEAGALGNQVLAGKSSPAQKFSSSNLKQSAAVAQMGVNRWALRPLAGLGTGTKARPEPKPEFLENCYQERKFDGNSMVMIGVDVGGPTFQSILSGTRNDLSLHV